MEYKSSEIKAGIFIIVSLVLFIAFLAIIIGMNSFSEKETYRARFSYVGGIEKGSVVRYAGLPVGSVIDVRLPGDDYPGAEVVLQVEKDTPIRVDSYAYMTSIGIMGSYYIEITSGSRDSAMLPTGSLIDSKDVMGFAQMTEPASEAMDELTELLRRMNLMLGKENRTKISEIVHSLNQISQITEENMQETLENFNILIGETQSMVAAARNIVVSNDSSIASSLASLNSTLGSTQHALQNLDSILAGVDQSILQNQKQYEQIVMNVQSLTQNLDEFSRIIKERPWTLVRKSYPPERSLP